MAVTSEPLLITRFRAVDYMQEMDLLYKNLQ
jgi:hypothetical protein